MAVVGGGLAIGVSPLRANVRVFRADDGSPEITAWVVIRADETVVLRIARTEMGQGSLTGLAQLVVEGLECDWNEVTWEYPTPGTNLARNGSWREMETGGSESILMSHEYLRKAGGAARLMHVQAAADAG